MVDPLLLFGAACAFGIGAFFFLRQTYANPPTTLAQHNIVRLLCAMLAGALGCTLTGSALFQFAQNWSTGNFVFSGAAGFALFGVVWLRFPAAPTLTLGGNGPVSLQIPSGWTFEHAAHALAQSRQRIASLKSMSAAERSSPLRAASITAPNLDSAMRQLGALSTIAIRDYSVEERNGVYHFLPRS